VEKNQATVPLPPPSGPYPILLLPFRSYEAEHPIDPTSFEMPAMLANQLATFDMLSGIQMQYNDTVHQILSVVLQESPGYLNIVCVADTFLSKKSV
jgi:hypothetical protein